MDKFNKQMDFLIEINKLKSVFRQSLLPEDGRNENDAEHSWHMCMYAIVLGEYAPEGTDMLKCIKMLLIHDLVEIYAGDTYLYDDKANEDKLQREMAAADKLYSMIGDQGNELKKLWYEFDECQTKEAVFANAIDRLQPILLNYLTEGKLWRKNNVNIDQVIEKGKWKTRDVDERIKNYVYNLLNSAVEKGYLGGSENG